MKCRTCGGGKTFVKVVDGRKTIVNCPICDGTGEAEEASVEPTLTDIKILLEDMVASMGKMVDTMVVLADAMQNR